MFHMNSAQSLNLIGCQVDIKGNFRKKYSIIFCSETINRMKLKLYINVYAIASTYIFIVFAYPLCCYGNL